MVAVGDMVRVTEERSWDAVPLEGDWLLESIDEADDELRYHIEPATDDGRARRWVHKVEAIPVDVVGETGPEVARSGKQVAGDHYEQMPVQPWDVIVASPWLDYWTGTALKYVMRAGRGKAAKVEDLRKAQHFIAKAIEIEEKGEARV